MNALLLTEQETSAPERLWLQYIIYAAIIVAGIIVLLLMKRASRLPNHKELRKRLLGVAASMDEAIAQARTRSVIKTYAAFVSSIDRLSFTVYAMAQKERDGELDNLSVLLEQARGELMKPSSEGNVAAARAKIGDGLSLLDKIIERDEAIAKKQ